MKTTFTEEETLLILWLRKARISAAEVMLTGQMLRGASAGVMGRRECVELGIREYRAMKKTVSFTTCVSESLKARAHRRPRTLGEIRSITARMMREWPELCHKLMRSLRAEDCRKILDIFPTPSGRRKARTILHGLCAYAVKRGWAERNPVTVIENPVVIERKVPVLTPDEAGKLIRTARDLHGGECLPAAVLMLYAGVRPQEVRRLKFKHLRTDDKAVIIPAAHSKTGGARRVTLHPVALNYLRAYHAHSPEEPLCPAGWERKWRRIRTQAGWNNNKPWAQDILRHTFASYHAVKFKDYSTLQWEMGHSNVTLLRTRYLNLDSISKKQARTFWLAA